MKKNLSVMTLVAILSVVALFAFFSFKASAQECELDEVVFVEEEILPLGRDEQSREPEMVEETAVELATIDVKAEEYTSEAVILEGSESNSVALAEEEMMEEEVEFVEEEILPLGRDEQSREPEMAEETAVELATVDDKAEEYTSEAVILEVSESNPVALAEEDMMEEEIEFVEEEILPLGRDIDSREPVEEN